ncbi:MAG: MBL fold metallo-hydrolase [Desulfobacteraceae bacterium]|nr:MBL fold metallo-hydrolase [Desulfobacteraceae bacterium]
MTVTEQMLSVCVLASGSKANAIYVSDGETAVLVDAGLSGIEIQRRMQAVNLDIQKLNAIIVSHEHSDHIRGVGVLARRYDLPVYISKQTYDVASTALGRIGFLNTIEVGTAFYINGLNIYPFSTCHDAGDPAGFTICSNNKKIGIATDLGIATNIVKQHLRNSSILVLEANHDPRMLTQGPYPWPLKQRIKGRNGHLSNESSRDLLAEIKHSGLSHVILAHLSEINNTPQKALETISPVFGQENHKTKLHVAYQGHCTDLLTP